MNQWNCLVMNNHVPWHTATTEPDYEIFLFLPVQGLDKRRLFNC